MKKKVLLVTGSSGLIGSEVVECMAHEFDQVYGIDNDMRAIFFGPAGSTEPRKAVLCATVPNFVHVNGDIRDRSFIDQIVLQTTPALIVHAAAQPSHDLAASIPHDDFGVNAVGTLNLLEAVRRYSRESVFVHLSTNKVYGDLPNHLALVEKERRWEFRDPRYSNGIDETMGIDQCKHSLFGASKVAADILVQEYGRYFGMATCCLRGGCLTGPNHAGVELHGFLNYLIKCHVEGKPYTIFGYKGKQVRDNIHSYDVVGFIREFFKAPRIAEVYNLGGGPENSISILEAIEKIESMSGTAMQYKYLDKPREGDHICYISDLTKARTHYPSWSITKSLDHIFQEIYEGLQLGRHATHSSGSHQ